jgi:hypothetical protein
MKNGKDPLEEVRELLRMTAIQTAENAKQLNQLGGELRKSRAEHDREMKDIRGLFK